MAAKKHHDDEVPEGLSKLDIEIKASNRMFLDVKAAVDRYIETGRVSYYCAIGCLEAMKFSILAALREDGEEPSVADDEDSDGFDDNLWIG